MSAAITPGIQCARWASIGLGGLVGFLSTRPTATPHSDHHESTKIAPPATQEKSETKTPHSSNANEEFSWDKVEAGLLSSEDIDRHLNKL